MINPIKQQNKLQRQNLLTKKSIIKVVGFFLLLTVIILLAIFVRFEVSPNANVPWRAGVSIITTISVVFLVSSFVFYLIYTRREIVSYGREIYVIGIVITFSFLVVIFIQLLDTFAVPATLTAFILAPLLKRRRDVFVANVFTNALILIVLVTEATFAYCPRGYNLDPFRFLDAVMVFNVAVGVGTMAAYLTASRPGRLKHLIKSLIIAAILYGSIISYALLRGLYINARIDYLYICPRHLPTTSLYSLIAAFAPMLIALLLQPILERAFNLLTESRLIDITDPNFPLLKRLRDEAPGTFNHSQIVANFAEMCATAIGENSFLARACAYYHDVGKLVNPQYYKENQNDINLHDELLPEVSVDIIRSHTEDGLVLCDKYKIPREVSHVTVQHHGTLLIPIFYNKAKALTDSEVVEEEYSYHGVRPRSKIAAIIMICDASEAAIRAMVEPNSEKIDKLLSNIIRERIEAEQFEKCEISLKDLSTIKETIISAYGGQYHTRLKYPEGSNSK